MMKECMKPHALLHLVSGAGLGLILLTLVPGLFADNTLMWGAILVVAGFVGEFVFLKK